MRINLWILLVALGLGGMIVSSTDASTGNLERRKTSFVNNQSSFTPGVTNAHAGRLIGAASYTPGMWSYHQMNYTLPGTPANFTANYNMTWYPGHAYGDVFCAGLEHWSKPNAASAALVHHRTVMVDNNYGVGYAFHNVFGAAKKIRISGSYALMQSDWGLIWMDSWIYKKAANGTVTVLFEDHRQMGAGDGYVIVPLTGGIEATLQAGEQIFVVLGGRGGSAGQGDHFTLNDTHMDWQIVDELEPRATSWTNNQSGFVQYQTNSHAGKMTGDSSYSSGMWAYHRMNYVLPGNPADFTANYEMTWYPGHADGNVFCAGTEGWRRPNASSANIHHTGDALGGNNYGVGLTFTNVLAKPLEVTLTGTYTVSTNFYGNTTIDSWIYKKAMDGSVSVLFENHFAATLANPSGTLDVGTLKTTLTVGERIFIVLGGRDVGNSCHYSLQDGNLGWKLADPLPEAPASLTVDVSSSQGTFNSDIYMAEGGFGGLADPNYWSSIATMLNAIGVKQVRIDHVWDYFNIVSRDLGGTLRYNWTNFDAVIEQILASGATPYLCVSYMPPALNPTVYGPPTSWADWRAINLALARHMYVKWSLKGLYYEIWNEPDWGFWTGTPAEYLELYRYAVNGIRTADPTAKVGGPAGGTLSWIEALLQFAQSNSLPLDFVSWHYYDPGLDYITYAGMTGSAKALLTTYGFPTAETIISEWNIHGDHSASHDAFYNAAHCGMVLNQFKESGLSKGFFYIPKDDPGPSELFGHFGAITYTNKPKPVYNFFLAYSWLVGDRVAVTASDEEVKAFAVRDGHTLRILLWNFDRLELFAKKRQINLTLNIAGSPMPTGFYTKETWLIDSTHSNVGYDSANPNLALVSSDIVTIDPSLELTISLENGGAELIEIRIPTPGDANGDGAVDVGDLGILAANYGKTSGATWTMGDFNGDRAVDVGDLGILAANYGTGVDGTSDFSTDYANAFGTTLTKENVETEETANSICSGLGLPLVVGLMLMGLMLVKWEE
jgi:xylan 1,4-beta-xylosidase